MKNEQNASRKRTKCLAKTNEMPCDNEQNALRKRTKCLAITNKMPCGNEQNALRKTENLTLNNPVIILMKVIKRRRKWQRKKAIKSVLSQV